MVKAGKRGARVQEDRPSLCHYQLDHWRGGDDVRYEHTLTHCTVVAGASGGIGQPLSLLLKASPLVDHLSLYDVVNTPGVTADLSHISSIAQIDGYLPADNGMAKAFKNADIVIIPAGIPRE